jgi:hypothetical protein
MKLATGNLRQTGSFSTIKRVLKGGVVITQNGPKAMPDVSEDLVRRQKRKTNSVSETLDESVNVRLAVIEERMRHSPTLSQIQWLVITSAVGTVLAITGILFSIKSLGVDAFSTGFEVAQATVQRDTQRDKEMDELRSLVSSLVSRIDQVQKLPANP